MSLVPAVRRALAAGGATVLALGMAACSSDGETRGESGEIISGGDTDVFALQVGDCFTDDSESEQVSSVPTVPCSEPHDSEIYAEMTFDDGDYPGDDALAETAWRFCGEQFASFVSLDYEDSALEYYPITPTQAGWEQIDDRLVSCAIYDPQGDVTGSLAGVGR